MNALVHRCLSVGLTFQVLPGFTLNINHLYTQIFLVLSVTICHDQLVSGISNNEEFYTLACITGVIMRVLRRLLCDLSLEMLSGLLKRCTHLIGFVLLLQSSNFTFKYFTCNLGRLLIISIRLFMSELLVRVSSVSYRVTQAAVRLSKSPVCILSVACW